VYRCQSQSKKNSRQAIIDRVIRRTVMVVVFTFLSSAFLSLISDKLKRHASKQVSEMN